MLKHNAVVYIVDSLAVARQEIEKQQPPSGNREPALLLPEEPTKDYGMRFRRLLVEAVSWGVWLGIGVSSDRVIETPLRIREEGRYGKPAKYKMVDSVVVLITKEEYLRDVSRELSNLTSVLARHLS